MVVIGDVVIGWLVVVGRGVAFGGGGGGGGGGFFLIGEISAAGDATVDEAAVEEDGEVRA